MKATRAFLYAAAVTAAGFTVAAALVGLDWSAFGVVAIVLAILAHGIHAGRAATDDDLLDTIRRHGLIVREIEAPKVSALGGHPDSWLSSRPGLDTGALGDPSAWLPTEAFDLPMATPRRGRHA